MTNPIEPACAVEEIEHLWIPLPDGIRLAARLWRPTGGDRHPAIFEIIPYRKRDMVRARDERNHPVFAAHGYVCLRVDMRGSGDSEGLMADMYSEAELADTRHVIEWIAAQPWCDGRVGMFGTSWGGTASLQASVDAPDALKAVIAVCATHDRYEDDIHHKGGCLLTDSIEWGATLPAILAAPPDAATVGPRWREMWLDRLENLAFPLETWIREEARGAYWRHGSVIHRRDAISIPAFCVGGWSDRYSNSVMSLVDARPDMVWGLVGPWGHHYPDVGHPGPAVDFQRIALEWWDRWLKRDGVGGLEWPRLRLWLREFDPPMDALDARSGGWVEASPPSSTTTPLTLHLSGGRLSEVPDAGALAEIPFDLRVGEAGGDTGYFGRFGGLPLDQAEDDRRSLIFETEPLAEDLILFGSATLHVRVVFPQPGAKVAARLCDVAADGISARIGLAFRNLALDDDFDSPDAPLACPRDVSISFHTTAYRIRAGHRLRLALSASYWPIAWPSAEAAQIGLSMGALSLPLHRGPPRLLAQPLPEPALRRPSGSTPPAQPPLQRRFKTTSAGVRVAEWQQPFASLRHPATDATFGYEASARHTIDPADPLSAESLFEHCLRFERPDGIAETHCRVRVTSDAGHFRIDGTLTATWNGEVVFKRRWTPETPRRLS
ncbi:MAG: CocE/NonD family hydrolase [Pseudomonadota bacterium]